MPRVEKLDALILGGGMAGLTAALTLRGFGLTAVVIEEAPNLGGQLHEIHAAITDHPLAFGRDGPRFASLVLESARRAELSILVGSPVTQVVAREMRVVRGREGLRGARVGERLSGARGGERLSGARGGERLRGRTLLLATGLRRRWLGIPGERELLGHGVSHSANQDRTIHSGKPVVVIGGGTGAVEDALLCAEVGSPVTLLHRSARFSARTDFLARARKNPGIRIVTNASVRRILGEQSVEGVEYRTKGSKVTRLAEADGVFVRIGWEPRTELLRGQIGLDRAGYVRVRPGGATSIKGVYAAGDVCSPRCPTIANAEGQGAAAAWEIARALGRVKG